VITLLRVALLCVLLTAMVSWFGGASVAGAQNAAYTDTMDSEADGLLSTVSPDPAIVSFAYQDGTFVMQAPNQASPKEILTDIKTPSMEGTQVLFDISISGDVNLKYVVVGCRAGPGHTGYQLAVNLDIGEATLRSRDGEYSQVLGRTEEPIALNTGPTMNQIGIVCEDTRISAIVNGVTVLIAFDTVYTDGYSYLGVGSRVGASGGLTATFDNLTVADLGGSGFEGNAGNNHTAPEPAIPGPTEEEQLIADPLSDPEAMFTMTSIMSVLSPSAGGPAGGSIDLLPGEASTLPLGVQLDQFYAFTKFVTPQVPDGLWLYSFCFWADASGSCTEVFVQSDGVTASWGLGYFPAGGTYELWNSGDMPAGAIDLTPGAENVMSLVVYQGTAILAVNGQIAAAVPVSGQPVAGDVIERVEYYGNEPAGGSAITMTTAEFAAWDLSDFADGFVSSEPSDPSDDLSIEDRTCRLTEPGATAPAHCGEEALG
jgi:hypothetical protein